MNYSPFLPTKKIWFFLSSIIRGKTSKNARVQAEDFEHQICATVLTVDKALIMMIAECSYESTQSIKWRNIIPSPKALSIIRLMIAKA